MTPGLGSRRPTRGVAGVPQQNFIGGQWAPAKDGATDEVLNPATGEVLAEVAVGEARPTPTRPWPRPPPPSRPGA